MLEEKMLAKLTELFERKDRLSRKLSELLDERLAMDADEGAGRDYAEWEERFDDVHAEYEEVLDKIDELNSKFCEEPDDDENDFDFGDEDSGDLDEDDDEKKGKSLRAAAAKAEWVLGIRPQQMRRRRSTGRITKPISPWELDKTSVQQTSKPSPPPEPTSYGGIEKIGNGVVRPEHIKENWWLEKLHETLAESGCWTEIEEELAGKADESESVPNADEPTGCNLEILDRAVDDGESVEAALFEAFTQWALERFPAGELALWEGRDVRQRFHQWVEQLSREQIADIRSAWLDARNSPEQAAGAEGLFEQELLPGPDIGIEPEPAPGTSGGGFTGVPEDPMSPADPDAPGGPGSVPADPLMKHPDPCRSDDLGGSGGNSI